MFNTIRNAWRIPDLRKKLLYLASCVSIVTLRKVGYRLEGSET